ncbi:MAG TPA: hypothetical protein EYP24_01065, partial [bacterium (Candidatus Stahlbacteria)]|nr:hypothetical protein [Candidatus Stahlbacteria bacterium]
EEAIKNAYLGAARVPFQVMERIVETLKILEYIGEHGLTASISDVGVAARAALACGEGAYLNVLINLKEAEDRELRERSEYLLSELRERSELILKKVLEKI